jgi:hypothetical protein
MRQSPAGDWTIHDVQAVCREFGILGEAPRSGGSHYKVAHPSMQEKRFAFIDAVRAMP